MELFNKQYVHFMWEGDLEGKQGFFANNASYLKEFVEQNDTERVSHVSYSADSSYPFADEHGGDYKFFYYDPNYEYKFAYAEGKQIQFLNCDGNWYDADRPCWDGGFQFRVKPGSSRRMTYRELAEWLAKGNGQYITHVSSSAYILISITSRDDNEKVPDDYRIRKWDSDEWITPTYTVYMEDCKK